MFINVPIQQPDRQLWKQHNIQTQLTEDTNNDNNNNNNNNNNPFATTKIIISATITTISIPIIRHHVNT
jgi:hypothetical protein